MHAAAVTRFNVEEDVARAVNVEGTKKVCAFARRCPNLEQLVVLSTIYSAGRRAGVVAEELHDDCGFVNFYEWSKWEAERYVLAECADLPAAVVRLATVIADDESGAVTQYNVFHNTLKLFYYGLMSLVPGDEATPTYLITGAFAADAIAAVLAADGRGVFNVCPERADAPTLGELVSVAFDVFEGHDDFRRRRLLRPLFCDREGFDHLVEGARTLGTSPLNQAVASMAPFAHELYIDKDVRNDRLQAIWPEFERTDPRPLVEATCEHLVRTRWGRLETRAS